jgi:hypothetical protein
MDAEPPHDDMPSDGSEEYYEDEDTMEAPQPVVAAGRQPEVEPIEGLEPEEEPAVAAMEAIEELEPEEEPAVAVMEAVEELEPEEEPAFAAMEPEPPLAKEEGGRHEVVVDLGHLESDDHEQGVDDDLEPPDGEGFELKEPVLAGAPVTPAERSGLLGAVRSAFARNRAAHEHEFVEAPGGIGIVRQICAECGYISIGVTD